MRLDDCTRVGCVEAQCTCCGIATHQRRLPNRERYVARELARRTGQAATADADDEDDLIVPENLKVRWGTAH